MRILAIESSCDETSAAVVTVDDAALNVESLATSSSMDTQKQYGGVVPEVAARKHLEYIFPVLDQAMGEAKATRDTIDLIAVTRGPGLMTSLSVGVQTAEMLALVWGKPVVGVNHLEGHILSPLIGAGRYPARPAQFPMLVLTVSGGHSLLVLMKEIGVYEVLGTTIDDAAGDAFDKVGKMLGLPYPGGPQIDKLAALGNPAAFDFPRALMQNSHYNFSFSGLKTSVKYALEKLPQPLSEATKADVAASFQRAVVDALVKKTLRAASAFGVKTLMLAGGVGANNELRARLQDEAQRRNLAVLLIDKKYSGDNAAMIALAGYYQWQRQGSAVTPIDIDPKLRV